MMLEKNQVNSAMVQLGVSKLNEENVFKTFFSKTMNEKNIQAKNVLLVNIMEYRFISGESLRIPFQKYCSDCNGKGFHVLDREFSLFFETCNFCQGTAVKTVPCKKCSDGILPDGSTCKTCQGTGRYRYRQNRYLDEAISCPKCRQGYIEKLRPTGRVLNWKTCTKCSGTSINPEFLNKVKNLAILQDSNDINFELAREEMEAVASKYLK